MRHAASGMARGTLPPKNTTSGMSVPPHASHATTVKPVTSGSGRSASSSGAIWCPGRDRASRGLAASKRAWSMSRVARASHARHRTTEGELARRGHAKSKRSDLRVDESMPIGVRSVGAAHRARLRGVIPGELGLGWARAGANVAGSAGRPRLVSRLRLRVALATKATTVRRPPHGDRRDHLRRRAQARWERSPRVRGRRSVRARGHAPPAISRRDRG